MANAEPEPNTSPPLLLRYKSFTLNVDDIPDAMFLKLLQAGFTKRMHDCVSGVRKKFIEEGQKPEYIEYVIGKWQREALQEILNGTWGQAKAKPPAEAKTEQTIELMMVKVAKEALRANAKARGDKAPKGQAMLEHVQTLLQTSEPHLRAEAERRLKAAGEII